MIITMICLMTWQSKGDRRQIIDDGILTAATSKRQKISVTMYLMTLTKTTFCLNKSPMLFLKQSNKRHFWRLCCQRINTEEAWPKKIKKKYQTQRQKRETIKRASKKAIEELKKPPVNYDDDANIDDLSTIGYNSDTENMLTIMVVRVAQQQAKRIKNIKT